MKPPRAPTPPSTERDSVLREVEQVLALARNVSLGPEFDDIIRVAVERATDRLMDATRRRTARLAALAEIQQAVATGFDLPAIMAGVYTHLRQIIDAPMFSLALYDAATGMLHPVFVVVDDAIVPGPLPDPFSAPTSVAGRVLESGIPLVHSERRGVKPDAILLPVAARSHKAQSVMLVPLRTADGIAGVIQALSYRSGAYGEEEVEFLSTIAHQSALALENRRLYEEALRRRREVEALLAAAQQLGAELDHERVLARVVETSAALVDAESAALGVVEHDGLHFERVWQNGVWRQVDVTIPTGGDGFAECFQGRPVRDNAPPRATTDALTTVIGPVGSRLAVPVLGSGRDAAGAAASGTAAATGGVPLLGVIALFNKRRPGGFTPHDLELTAAFASHAAAALERATVYRAMEQSRNYHQTLMDRSYSAIFVLDPASGRIRDVNAAATELLGRQREQVLGQTIFAITPPEDHQAWSALLAEAPDGGDSILRELHVQIRDGTPLPLDVTATRLDVEDAPALVCLARDRRPRIRQEERERLRALGEMASGVAHDFNNLLGIILGRTELLANRANGVDPESARDFEVVRQAALDGAETVKRLQAFSGVARLTQKGSSDANQVMYDAVEFTRPRWRDAAQQRGVTIDVLVEPGVTPPVAGSPPELREVLVNLLFNSVDAMPDGGEIRLRSSSDGERVFISVSDNGCGMTEAVRRRVFEPFYTTKGSRGAGLGLSASYGIISRMGGRISVESVPDHGATFTLDLPAGRSAPMSPPAAPVQQRPLSLLLVDDEPQMLRTTKMMLEIEGHQVVAVTGGRPALEAFERQPFDAVLTDLGMPEINGLQLTEELRSRGYTQPVLLITGWGFELEVDRVRALGVSGILPKPFDGEKLRAKLAAITAPPNDAGDLVHALAPAGR